MSLVCVDASLVLLILLPQERSERAEGLWTTWQNEGNQVIAPPLLYAEVPSVLREAGFHHRLTEEEGEEAFEVFCQLGGTGGLPARSAHPGVATG